MNGGRGEGGGREGEGRGMGVRGEGEGGGREGGRREKGGGIGGGREGEGREVGGRREGREGGYYKCAAVTWCLLWSPGEDLESGIKNSIVLQLDEAVVVTAQEEFDDTLPDGEERGRGGEEREGEGR